MLSDIIVSLNLAYVKILVYVCVSIWVCKATEVHGYSVLKNIFLKQTRHQGIERERQMFAF